MQKLFVYGTLMNDEVLASLLTGRFAKTKALLSGYQCLAVLNEDYPAIRPAKDSMVNGELISGLSPEHLRVLDQYEGKYYQRTTVTVVTTENSECDSVCSRECNRGCNRKYQCETYVFKQQYYNLLSESGWSNAVFRTKYMQAFINNVIE